MSVNASKNKGTRAETLVRDILRKHTNLVWERTPLSGALDAKHGLKSDLYVPNEKNLYAVEVKHYADDHITSAILSSKCPQLLEFWAQTTRQGTQVKKQPLLIFKYDRSKVFVAFDTMPDNSYPYIFVSRDGFEFYVALLEDWLINEQPKFVA